MNGILDVFQLTFQTSQSLRNGVNDLTFNDLEDSYQAHATEEANCNVILTIDRKHFSDYAQKSTIEVLTPQQFIDKYI